MSSKSKKTYEMEIPSIPEKIQEVERLAEKVAGELGFGQDEQDSLAIAVTEAVNNAIQHGNKGDRRKKVRVRFEISDNSVIVRVADQGAGFDPEALSDPLTPENLLKESGRGIFILRTLMDEVSFSFSDSGSEITMVKKKK